MPDIDYTSKDFAGFRQFLIERKKDLLPEWSSEAPGDFGIVLIELFSYMGDILSFYGDRTAAEAYLSTATQRRSILAIAEMLDYTVTSRVPATVVLQFSVNSDMEVPAGTQVRTSSRDAMMANDDPVVFEVIEATDVTAPSGSVQAREGLTISEETVAVSDGAVDQTYSLFQFPVIEGSIHIFVDEGGGDVEWTRFTHLIDAANVSEAFEVEIDENDVASIRFGDNVNGRVPTAGSTIRATYRIGGGERGNVGPGTITELVAPAAGITEVTNSAAATGGSDAESNDQIRTNAPRSLTALNRAVTLKDYASLAIQVPGIDKARATNVDTDVTVFLAPAGGGTANSALKDQVAAYLDERKMINHTVTLDDPTYVDMTITVSVEVLPNYSRSAVARSVENAVNRILSFSNVDFAYRVSLSKIYDAVQSVAGVDYADITELSTDGAGGVADAVLGETEIPQVGETTINATGGIAGT